MGQRGNHGKLAGSVASGYVYTSKDGTGYHFAAAPDPHGRFPVLQVADRNGNALTYTYEEQAIDEAIDGGNFVYSPTEFKLTRVTDQAGRYLSFSYARADNGFVRLTGVKAVVASENSPENIEVEFEYFKDESAEPEQEANRFDVVGMLRKVSRADFTETYAYDSSLYDGQPNLTSVTDAIGNKTKYQYYDTVPAEFLGVAPGTVLTDVVQKVCYPTEHENDLCQKDFATFDYNIESGNQRVVTDLRGYATIYLLNRWGNPSRIEEPEGKTVEYDWSIDLGETDNVMRFKRDLAINAEWEYRYDAQGNLTREIDPFGEESEQRWNQQFSILEYRKDKNGSVFEQVLDANGNVLNEVQTATVDGLATTVVVEHNYSNFGPFINLREWTENARNFKTYFDYDQNGNVKSITSPPDGSTEIVTHYQNDNRGLKVLETDPNGNATEFRYDALDRLQWQIDAEGNTTQIEYDPKGNKDWEEFTDSYYSGETVASKHTRVLKLDYGYDARDRVASVVRTGSLDGKSLDANGDALFSGMRSYTYDGNSNVLTETDWFNRATVHKYEDGLNRRTQTTDRDQNVMSYDYDFRSQAAAPLKKGLVKTVTDFNGRQSQEYYDVLNRLYRTELPTVHAHSVTGGADEALNYFRTTEYDKLNNVLATTDEEGNTTQFEYDGRYLRTRRINALNDVFEWHYDANGSLLRTVDEEERETVYVYNAQDRLSSKTEPEGHVWQYPVYRANGTLKKEIDPWGFEHSYSYDKINRKTTVTTPDGLEIVRYTNDGQLSYRKDAGNRASANIYGPESRLMVSIDGRGRTSSHSYDKNANLTDTVLTWDQAYTGEAVVKTHTKYDVLDRKTELHEGYLTPLVRVTHYDYDNMGNLKTVLRPDENNPDGQLTTYVLDELNRVKTTIVPQTTNYAREPATADDLATTIKQRYNGLGNVVWLQDRRGNVTQTSYDALQRVDVITDATAQANTIDHEYDKVGNLRFIKDKRGNVKESVYDGLNRVTEQYINTITDTAATTLAAASTREFRLLSNNYDTSGFGAQERQNSVTDAEGNTVVSLLDWRGNTVEQTLPAGEDYPETTLAQVYDGSGWLEKTTTDNAFETRYTYFADGTIATQTQVQSLTGIADEVTAYQYDIFGNQALVVKPKLNQQIATYDVRNRLALVEDHLGNQTRFEYDANNNLLRQFQPAANDDGDENLVQYVYDERNRKRGHIQHKATGNLVSLFDYDAEGNLAQQIDPKGHVFAFEYDALNRQRLQTYPVGGDIESIVSTYDANSNLDVVTEHKTGGVVEVTDHDYDLLDRLEQRVQRGHVVSYSYDNNGNRLSVTSPGGTTVNTFDTRNRLDTVVANGTTTSYTYLPTGWTDVVTHGNGTAVDYDYDDAGRTLKIANTDASATVLSQFDYGYDANGNRDSQIETQNGFSSEQVVTTAYVYDDLDRLESYTHTQAGGASVESHTYTYYPSYDRRTEVVVEDGVTVKDRTYSYDETYWVDTITEAAGTGGTISYAYDNNGNSLSKSSTTGEGPASTVFTYNSRNQLTTFAAGNAGSELSKGTYAYNYAGMRIRHLGSERGNIEYIYDDNSIIDELSNNTTFQVAHYRYGDRLLSLQNATGVDQFYHYAGLGTTTNLTDASGENQIAYRVDPFGAIVKEEGSSVNRQVFTGHEHDKETGLIYMKARFYDPDIARFINQDTYLGESTTPPSLHRYLYAYGNPTYYTDPTGNFAVTDWLRQETEAASNSVKQWADEVHNSDSSSAVKSIKGTGANLLAGFDDSVAFVLGAADEAADIALSAFGDREILGQNSYRRTQARLAETVTIAKTVADTTTAYLTEENLSGRVMDDAGRAKQVATDYGRKLRDGDSRAWSGIYAGVASFGSGAALKLGKAGASTATDNAVPSFKNNQATSAWTQNSSDARYVLRDIESHTDLPIHKNQRAELANYLRDNDHRFAVTKPEYEAVKKEYRKLRPQMIRDWEANTGQTWPKTDKSVPYQAHHIITERYGGANTWWNIHPARFPDQHQAGIHRADGATSQVFPHNPVREQ